MVMSDSRVKQIDSNRNARSRGSSPSPNNINTISKPPSVVPIDDLTPETSDDDSHSKKNGKPKKSEFEEKIRVGKDYQVFIPEVKEKLPESYFNPYPDKALLVWSPAREISESNLEEYVCLAKEQYGYNAEQALGMLFWHKHDLERAVTDLANFTPFPDEWSKEDKVLFEQAFQFHGKSFHRIRQMLPDKSIANLVKFYYSWKKTRSRTSVMDRQEKKKIEGNFENGSENGSPDDSDIEDKKWPIRGIRRTSRSINPEVAPSSASSSSKVQDTKRFGTENKDSRIDTGYSSSSSSSNGISKLSSLNCQNCTVLCNDLKTSPVGSFCMSCFHHWRRTGVLRPTQGPQNIASSSQRPRSKSNKLYYYQGYHDSSGKYKKKPPKGMYINHDDVVKLAAIDKTTKESHVKQPGFLGEVEREINVLYTTIQKNKQKISSLKVSNGDSHDGKLLEEVALTRIFTRWTKDECSLAVMGFRKYGQNFKAIAEVLGTKTESHVRKFFAKYRKSKNLDSLCQESKMEISLSHDGAKEVESIEIDSDDDVQQVKDHEVTDDVKTLGKMSILTAINGKTPKRKHEDDGDILAVGGNDGKPEKLALESLDEITLTPIPKIVDDKTNAGSTH